MKVYVSSTSADLGRAKNATARLQAAGVTVTSTWISTVENIGCGNPTNATVGERRGWSVADLNEVDAADLVWFIVPTGPTRGAWVEIGYGFARGKRIVCSGTTKQSIFCALGDEYENDDQAFNAIARASDDDLQLQKPGRIGVEKR